MVGAHTLKGMWLYKQQVQTVCGVLHGIWAFACLHEVAKLMHSFDLC